MRFLAKMANREEEKPEGRPSASEILQRLAQDLSFAKVLESFPGLSLTDLRRVLLEAGQRMQEGSQPADSPAGAYRIYIDGASKGNPGAAGTGVLIYRPDGELLCQFNCSLGIATNNVAEYSGLILALEKALELGLKRIEILSDSELLIKQMNGQYSVRDEKLKALWARARTLIGRFPKASLRHIPREENRKADQLAKAAAVMAPLR